MPPQLRSFNRKPGKLHSSAWALKRGYVRGRPPAMYEARAIYFCACREGEERTTETVVHLKSFPRDAFNSPTSCLQTYRWRTKGPTVLCCFFSLHVCVKLILPALVYWHLCSFRPNRWKMTKVWASSTYAACREINLTTYFLSQGNLSLH